MSTRSPTTMTAVSTEVKSKPASPTPATDPDPAFILGASVLVGGVKPGRLRYVGGVHFVAGQWCGIELDDADGLHDGTVDGVRYFTCRDGHGIFAPRQRVILRPLGQPSALPGSPDVRRRVLRKPTANVQSSSAEDGDVHRLFGVSSPRHRHQASLDGRDLNFSSTLKSGARPQSAILTDDEAIATADSNRKRSSLLTGRIVSSETRRSSPKRVTFFDEIISSKERGVPSVRTDVEETDRRRRGHENVDNASDARVDRTDLEEGSPFRKTSRTDGNHPLYSHRAYVDSDLDSARLDLETANMLTSDPEISLSSDSIEADEIDDDFAAYGLTSVARTRPADAQTRTSETTASKSPKTRVDEVLSDLEHLAGCHQHTSSDFSNKPSGSGAHFDAQSSTSPAARASFELARTALTQYADLVRAAQESTAARRSWTPPAVRRVLPTPVTSTSSAENPRAFEHEAPAKELGDDDGRLRRSPEPVTLDGGSGSGSGAGSMDEVDFETFDGEELDSIGDAMIDSIDGSSVQSEDSIAMLPHLSDADDDDVVESGRGADDKRDQVVTIADSTTASDKTTSTTHDRDNDNAVDDQGNERTATGSDNSNNVVDVNLLNDLNNAVTCRQFAFADTQTCREISRGEQPLVVGIADSHAAATTTTAIANIDYFLRHSTTVRDERPMSLISDSSSTDTGEYTPLSGNE